MYKIAIAEDDLAMQQTLSGFISKFCAENNIHFNVSVFSDGDELLADYKPEYDIILLDIQMKRIDGMETARKIRKLGDDVIIIFITNMSDYAIKGYSVDAMDFIVKPVPYFAFTEQLKKAISRLKKRKKSYITLKTGEGILHINTSDVYYIESYGHRLFIYTAKGKYEMSKTMRSMEETLHLYNFYRSNNCYLVNLAHVEKVNNNIVTVAGSELQISRPKRKGFLDALTDYIGGSVR